jgi:membrane peptidoglycan carboxypeptidase
VLTIATEVLYSKDQILEMYLNHIPYGGTAYGIEAAAQRYRELQGKQKNSQNLNGDQYNLGNALYQAGKYKESIDAYKNALRKTPGDMDAKHNLQLAMKKLEMQQQQNKENQQNKKDNKQDNKENSKQDDKKDDNQQQDQNEKNQPSDMKNDQQQNKQNMSGQISPQDAERILQALENEEKDVLQRVQEQQKKIKKVPVEKNW